jgi:hypothetical protein
MECGVRRCTPQGPPRSQALAVGTLTVVSWLGGRPTVEVLAETGPHGEWLRWTPGEYPYAIG